MEKFNNSFADFEISKSIEARYSKHPLYKIERLVDWEMIAGILQKADFRYEGRVGGECYGPLFMFRILFIQRLCGFSDEQMEDQIYANLFYKAFCRISLDSKIPDSTTIGRWRNRFVALNIFDDIFSEIIWLMHEHGLDVEVKKVLVDCTFIESAARPKKKEEICIEATNEAGEQEQVVTVNKEYSNDPDARWGKNGSGFHFGFKSTFSTSKDGIILGVTLDPANVYDGHLFQPVLLKTPLAVGAEVYTDKGFASSDNDEWLSEHGLGNFISKKQKPKQKDADTIAFNKLISKARFPVERTFGSLKKNLKIGRSVYIGLNKTYNFVLMGAIVYNLIRSVNIL